MSHIGNIIQKKEGKITLFLKIWQKRRRPVGDDFEEFIREGMAEMQWTEGTVRRWKTFRLHFDRYIEWQRGHGSHQELAYEDLDERMLSSFVQYLTDICGFRNSTVAKELKMLKWFLRWADRKGFLKSRDYDNFQPKIKNVRSPVVFLTSDELMKLYRLELPDGEPLMSLTRDIFCFCSFTSLRFSDASKLKASNIQGNRLVLTTQKTNDTISIDINPFAQEIIDRYLNNAMRKGTLFPHIAMSTANIYIKQLGRMCCFDSPVTRTWFCGRQRKEETLPKWQCLSTHAARRTFICTALAAGVNAETVMKWTGHSSYKSMKPYIDINDEDKARAMEKVFAKLQ